VRVDYSTTGFITVVEFDLTATCTPLVPPIVQNITLILWFQASPRGCTNFAQAISAVDKLLQPQIILVTSISHTFDTVYSWKDFATEPTGTAAVTHAHQGMVSNNTGLLLANTSLPATCLPGTFPSLFSLSLLFELLGWLWVGDSSSN